MKKILTSLCILSAIGLSDIQAQQKKETWKNDPTYSVNNYKHPNKAVVAKSTQSSSATNFVFENKPASSHHTSRITAPDRKILATDKTKNGKVKTPLAIRRKASEKLPDFVLDSQTDQQQMDD